MFDCSVPFAKQLVSILVRAKYPVMLWGAPGTAKSAAVGQVCSFMTNVTGRVHKLWDCRLSQKEPTDLGGLPFAKDGFTSYLPPRFMPQGEEEGIFFADEGNRAERPTQQAFFQLVYDREFGEYKLPSGVSIVLAGNLGDEDMSIVNEYDAPFCNRLFHLRVVALQKDWERYMAARGKTDGDKGYVSDIEKYTWIDKPEKSDLVVRFLRSHEMHFMGKPCIGAFPTGRTWEMLENVVEHLGGDDADPILVNALAIAVVGDAAGIAFAKWFREKEEFKPTLIVDEYSKAIKAKFLKLSTGYKLELYTTIAEHVNKMTKFSDKQKKNITDFVFDSEVCPEEMAVTMMTVWSSNTQVLGILQSVGTKFLSYFRKVKK